MSRVGHQPRDRPRRFPRWAQVPIEIAAVAYAGWRDDRCIRLGAGLAYYGLFALVPLLSLSVAIAGVIFSTAEVRDYLDDPLARLLGADSQDVAARLATQVSDASLVTQFGLVGLAGLVVAASVVFVALQDALNQVWHVPYETGLRQGVRRRLLSFGIVLLLSAVLLLTLVAQALLGLVEWLVPVETRLGATLVGIVDGMLPWVLGSVALAVVFAVLPRATVNRRAALVAGAATAAAMAAAAVVVGWYLGRFGTASVQGAASSVFVALTALYVQCQILLAGAVLTRVLTERWA